ncbi:MAG TPA: PAS domain-containing sensor histidine kinase [Kiritimatiellia bacterium]|nr:PAS domain-containing sensor histidine kinase [Kiritimatiellia bacterium]HMO99478.1 PAS domain-containing sensor histidine kinase [Kiritimatiellia bacterium]HMP97069.1 PAS domain-containing sensor histidine kinase [Kiritimatiellia bacterium]
MDPTVEQRWRLLFEQSPLSIQIFAPDGQTIAFNPAWSRLFGLSDEEAYAFNVLQDPTLEQSGALAFIRRAFAGEVVFVPPIRFPVRNHPTDMRWIGGTVFPVITPDGILREVVVVHHDITELKQAEETQRNLNVILEARVAERTAALQASEMELRAALDAERELNLLKTSFVGMVSHEFRTPLGVIQTATDLLQRHHDKLTPGQREKELQSILRAVSRMTGMMEDILLLGRLDSHTFQPRWTPVHIPAWIHQNLDVLCPSAADSDRMDISMDASLIRRDVLLDETLMHHILGNLLSNACKYSPPDSPVRITVSQDNSELVFSITDQGIGITPDDQARLFEGFFRASNVGNRPGSGLGLVIAQRCIQRMGGRLELSSRLDEGSTFRVFLPVMEATSS